MTGKILRTAFLAPLAFLAAQPVSAQVGASDLAEDYRFNQDYAPDPAIWAIRDEDTTIYMLGTIHALPRGFRWRSPLINQIIEESDVLVLEDSEYAPNPDALNVDVKITGRTDRRRPTSAQLTPEARPHWRDLIGRTVLPFEVMDSMPVMLALLTLGSTGDTDERGVSYTEFGVEPALEREFLSRQRPIETIEDSGEVMYSLLRLDNAEVMADLSRMLVEWSGKETGYFYSADWEERVGDEYWAAEHAWARGEVAEEFSIGIGNGLIGQSIDAMLLDRRNTEWAQWLQERLEEPGTTLVAVGAGHFEGDVSVLVKLAERGIDYERVN
ncbi:TraB/GumN family protein [Aurantiacibacter sediminis]|uniref:TraB/GumN family protein n=1 Tax=Aurantiacibacter sediminis TaxID=2793064 RepID=A0ABS0N3W1_9SPHN|nr:TraB/GumN family protein [Aurantiacibacter sediminis]MBH5322658.1 TraB/GumN family protein [Aurantiacibacter sediminis]